MKLPEKLPVELITSALTGGVAVSTNTANVSAKVAVLVNGICIVCSLGIFVWRVKGSAPPQKPDVTKHSEWAGLIFLGGLVAFLLVEGHDPRVAPR
jgi:hypothetical protein